MKRTIYLVTLAFLCFGAVAQPGHPDPGFGSGLNVLTDFGGNNEQAWAIAVQPDGKVLVAGFTGNGGHLELTNNFDIAVARFNTNGTLDNTFSGDGKFTLNIAVNDQAHGIAIQGDGKIIVVGKAGSDFAVLRLNPDGTLDNTFDGDGWLTTHINPGINQANAIAIQPDGKYVVTGSAEGGPNNSDFAVVRYNTNGSLDNTFDGDGIATADILAGSDDYPLGLALQSDGKIVLAGTSIVGSGLIDVAMARLNSNGSIDNTFSGDGVLTTNINVTDIGYDVAIDANGKIVVGGSVASQTYRDDDITRDFMVIRYNSDGTLDNTFNGTGIKVWDLGGANDDKGNDIAIEKNGKIIIGGYSDRTTNHDYSVARLNSNGTLDITFDGDGIASFPPVPGELTVGISMKLFQNRIYLAGTTYVGGVSDISLIAFQVDGNTLPLDLLSFNASKQNSDVLLQWQTTREINIMGFDIQRSADGKTFKNIGYSQPINANGATKKNYSFTDNSPVAAVNYYRLVIKDLDGSFTYSKVLAIKNSGNHSQLEVFPSPVGSTLQVQLPSGITGKANLQISDISGRLVRTIVVEPKGYALATTIDVNSLTKGVYVIKVQSENNVNLTTRFVKN